MSTRVTTGTVRFSYANVFKPKAIQEGQDPKYSVAILIPKNDKATLAKLEAAIEEAIEAGKTKFGKYNRATLKLPLRDGDEERGDDEAYKGHYFINANSTQKPGVVDASLNEIISADEFYSGCYGRASVNFYAFNTNGNKGVAAGLGNLQFLKDGERLSGGASAEQDFAEDSDDIL